MSQNNTGINKMYSSFILFFLLSVVFWFMTKLSKEYEGTIKYPVVYNNLPDNKLLQENPLDFIEVYVKASRQSNPFIFNSLQSVFENLHFFLHS